MKSLYIYTLMLSSFSALSQGDTLIYIGDPMCSWCYGFGPELDKIKAAFPNTPIKMVMGGLRAGGTENMQDLKNFLSDHWADVEKASGQRFNHSILNDSYLIYDTEPACRAVQVVEHLKPSKTYDFFKQIQKDFYFYNHNPLDFENYGVLAQKLGIPKDLFLKTINSYEAKAAVQASFDYAAQLGAKGFPTLLAKIDGHLFLVTNGYQKAEKLIVLLERKGLK